LQNVARLLHFPFDELRGRVVTPKPRKRRSAVEFDDGDSAVRAEVFLQVGKIAHPVFNVVISVDRQDKIDTPCGKQRIVRFGENHSDVGGASSFARFVTRSVMSRSMSTA